MYRWNLAPLLFLFALVTLASAAWADTPPVAAPAATASKDFPDLIFAQPESAKAAMDINPDLYADFWKKWHFVSARWRQDSHEIRLSYANDLAWKTLSEHRTDYPVGAMFGKLVYPAEEDLALPSSVMGSNLLSRFMIMLWDPKHKKVGSDGWVYLRFINRDPTVSQDKNSTGVWGVMSQKEIDSCVECHNRAYDRGNVFSQPMFLFRDKNQNAAAKDTKVLSSRFGDVMKEMAPNAVPRIAVNLIQSVPEWKDRKIMGYEGDFFIGSLGEIAPVLGKLAQKNTKAIYIIYDRDDPNTFEMASSIKKKGYENCAGVVRLRGTALNTIASGIVAMPGKRDANQLNLPQAGDDEYGAHPQGVRVRDLTKAYKPSAMMYTYCGEEGISVQSMPLLYNVKDKDGLPSYYFAPAVIDEEGDDVKH